MQKTKTKTVIIFLTLKMFFSDLKLYSGKLKSENFYNLVLMILTSPFIDSSIKPT